MTNSPAICPDCSQSDFRLSHFRWSDLGPLLLLQYPLRCRQCFHRSYGNLLFAWHLHLLHKHKHAHKQHAA